MTDNSAWGGHPLGHPATTRRLNEVFGETPPATEAPQGREALEKMLYDLRSLGCHRREPCGVHAEPQWTCGFCLCNILEAYEAVLVRASVSLEAPLFTRFVAEQCDDQVMVIKADGDTPDVGQVLYLASEVDAALQPAAPASAPDTPTAIVAVVDGRCGCARCRERTENIYRMIGVCLNCGAKPLLMLFRAGDPTANLDCPLCGVWRKVMPQRRASEDEIPAAELPAIPAPPASLPERGETR